MISTVATAAFAADSNCSIRGGVMTDIIAMPWPLVKMAKMLAFKVGTASDLPHKLRPKSITWSPWGAAASFTIELPA